MPINPNITLSVKHADLPAAQRRGTQEAQRGTLTDLAIQKKRQEIETSNATEEIKRTGRFNRDTVLPLLKAGRIEDLRDILLDRIPEIEQRGENADGTRQALKLLKEGNTTELERISKGVIQVARENKLIGAAETGKQVNAQLQDGRIVSLIENPQGQLVDPVTRKQVPGAIKAPAKSLVATGTAADLRTKSQIGKEQVEAREAEIGLRQNVTDMNRLRDIVASEDFVGGTAGQVASLINSAAAQVRQVSGEDPVLRGKKLNKALFAKGTSKETFGRFRKAAITADRFESAVLELAFLKAKSLNPDGKISDADVRAAEKILGKGADKASRLVLIDDIIKRTVEHFNIAGRVRSKEHVDLTADEILGRKTQTGTAAAPSGSVEDTVSRILQEELGQ